MRARVAMAAGLLALCLSAPALAHSYKFGDIEVGHLWGPPPSATSTTETDVYGPIFNTGAAGDRLLSATSPLAAKIEFRTGKDEAPAGAAIDLPPGKPVSLAPWGAHLRFIGLKQPLKEKDWVPIHLVFEKAGAHDAKVLIETEADH